LDTSVQNGSFTALSETVQPDNAGDSLATAVPLSANAGPIAGAIESAGDVDFFRLDPAAVPGRGAGTMYSVTGVAQGFQARLSLFDSAGNLIAQSDGQSATDPDPRLDFSASATYYLEIEATDGGIGAYTLLVNQPSTARNRSPISANLH